MASDRQETLGKVAESLRGTIKNLDDTLEYFDLSFDELTFEDCLFLDGLVFQCEGCGWWVETSEIGDNNKCEDCRGEA